MFSSCGQQRLWSHWLDAQTDLSLRWAHRSFCWFCHVAPQSNNSTNNEQNQPLLFPSSADVPYNICTLHLTSFSVVVSYRMNNQSNVKTRLIEWSMYPRVMVDLTLLFGWLGFAAVNNTSTMSSHWFWICKTTTDVPRYNDHLYNGNFDFRRNFFGNRSFLMKIYYIITEFPLSDTDGESRRRNAFF